MTVSVLGCGWLGGPLGVYLVEKGYRVKGSTTRKAKLRIIDAEGIEPYLIELGPEAIEGNVNSFLESDVLVLNFPPNGDAQSVRTIFPETVAQVIKAVKASPLRKIVFVSSSSVYGDQEGETVTESAPLKPEYPSSEALVEAERMLLEDPELEVCVLRMGGLVGGNRQPYLFLAGRMGLTGGEMPVNLVHQVDAIRAIEAVIRHQAWGKIFNIVADQHPTRREYYTAAATRNNLSPPEFIPDPTPAGKSVSSARIKTELGFTFRYSDPYHML